MRYFIIAVLMLFNVCSATQVYAQDGNLFSKKYTSSFSKGSVKNYLKDIEEHAGVHVSYSDASVSLKSKLKLQFNEVTVYEALQQILAGQQVQIIESGDKILIVASDTHLPDAHDNPITISGYVKDVESKEVLIGAAVYVPELGIGITTNSYGFYSLTVPAHISKVLCSYIGYTTDTLSLSNGNARLDVLLKSHARLQEVIIVDNKQTSPDHNHLNYNDIKERPVVLGENDVMRALQFLPGVQQGTEGTNTIMVRGGDPGQNLNLLDGVPLYYVDHFFGLTSVYNSEAIKSVDFHKGAFPSRYGGRLSSVIDVNTKDGDMERIGGQFSMGLIKGSLNLEGPVIKDKASIMISARRTWLDFLWRPFTSALRVNFYDVNVKANYIVNKNNRLYLSVYNGRDRFGYQQSDIKSIADWGNTVYSLKWTTIVNPKLFVHTTLTDSKFKFSLQDNQQVLYQGNISGGDSYEGHSSVNDLALRVQANWYASPGQRIEFGAHYSLATFIPSEVYGAQTGSQPLFPVDKFHSNEVVFFAEDAIAVNKRWSIRPGIHFAAWFSGQFNYPSIQPRFYTSYKVAEGHSIYASYTQMAQFLHMINANTYGLPTDFWLPSSSRIKPEESSLTTAGYTGKGKLFTYNIEGYYKYLHNTTTYGLGKNIFDNSLRWDEKLVQGKGWSYGAEVSGKLAYGKFVLSVAYTLSWTWRQFSQLNDGKAFPYKYDRRHNLRATLLYQPSSKFDAAASWTYMSGEAITLPDQIYPDFDNNLLIQPAAYTTSSNYTYNYTTWNNYRLPPIHRLDIGLNFTHKKGKYMERTWSLGVFNAYGRHNVMFVNLVNEGDGSNGNLKLTGVSFLRFVPFISYKLKF